MHVWTLVNAARTPCARYVNQVLNFDVHAERTTRLGRVRQQTESSSKTATYCLLNPSLAVHSMYNSADAKEFQRLAITRLRLSSHNLA